MCSAWRKCYHCSAARAAWASALVLLGVSVAFGLLSACLWGESVAADGVPVIVLAETSAVQRCTWCFVAHGAAAVSRKQQLTRMKAVEGRCQ